MRTPIIRVATRPTVIRPPAGQLLQLDKNAARPVASSYIRLRFCAEFVGGPHAGEGVDGKLTCDEAIGALVRWSARAYATADQVLDFVASLFGDLRDHSANDQLTRALWFAGPRAKRRHALGVRTGAQLRARVRGCDTSDEVLDVVASLFGDPSKRSPDAWLGQAIRLAAQGERRRHPGVRVVVIQTPRRATAERGGVA